MKLGVVFCLAGSLFALTASASSEEDEEKFEELQDKFGVDAAIKYFRMKVAKASDDELRAFEAKRSSDGPMYGEDPKDVAYRLKRLQQLFGIEMANEYLTFFAVRDARPRKLSSFVLGYVLFPITIDRMLKYSKTAEKNLRLFHQYNEMYKNIEVAKEFVRMMHRGATDQELSRFLHEADRKFKTNPNRTQENKDLKAKVAAVYGDQIGETFVAMREGGASKFELRQYIARVSALYPDRTTPMPVYTEADKEKYEELREKYGRETAMEYFRMKDSGLRQELLDDYIQSMANLMRKKPEQKLGVTTEKRLPDWLSERHGETITERIRILMNAVQDIMKETVVRHSGLDKEFVERLRSPRETGRSEELGKTENIADMAVDSVGEIYRRFKKSLTDFGF